MEIMDRFLGFSTSSIEVTNGLHDITSNLAIIRDCLLTKLKKYIKTYKESKK
jgi:hypothetical protein